MFFRKELLTVEKPVIKTKAEKSVPLEKKYFSAQDKESPSYQSPEIKACEHAPQQPAGPLLGEEDSKKYVTAEKIRACQEMERKNLLPGPQKPVKLANYFTCLSDTLNKARETNRLTKHTDNVQQQINSLKIANDSLRTQVCQERDEVAFLEHQMRLRKK